MHQATVEDLETGVKQDAPGRLFVEFDGNDLCIIADGEKMFRRSGVARRTVRRLDRTQAGRRYGRQSARQSALTGRDVARHAHGRTVRPITPL
jgi:hypothetical protein